MKIHIILEPAFLDKLKNASEKEVDRYLADLKVKKVNRKRLLRYGVITCEVEDEKRMEELRQQPGVETIERDTTKHAT
jgi:hypothetical protein